MASLTLVPLLEMQRDLYAMPRNMARFRHYLWLISEGTDRAVRPPLIALNPMAKAKAPAGVDALLALDAEAVTADALAEFEGRLPGALPDLRLSLVVCDDVEGSWTDRAFAEIGLWFAPLSETRTYPKVDKDWTSVPVWTSETPTRDLVRGETLATLYRLAYRSRHGTARTLRDMMTQEGRAAVFAGATGPVLGADDLAYSGAVIGPYLDATHMPVYYPCLYGDASARAVGYTPLGLSPRAGYAVGRSDAIRDGTPPERFVSEGVAVL
jgi:hypothetical protein